MEIQRLAKSYDKLKQTNHYQMGTFWKSKGPEAMGNFCYVYLAFAIYWGYWSRAIEVDIYRSKVIPELQTLKWIFSQFSAPRIRILYYYIKKKHFLSVRAQNRSLKDGNFPYYRTPFSLFYSIDDLQICTDCVFWPSLLYLNWPRTSPMHRQFLNWTAEHWADWAGRHKHQKQ